MVTYSKDGLFLQINGRNVEYFKFSKIQHVKTSLFLLRFLTDYRETETDTWIKGHVKSQD